MSGLTRGEAAELAHAQNFVTLHDAAKRLINETKDPAEKAKLQKEFEQKYAGGLADSKNTIKRLKEKK